MMRILTLTTSYPAGPGDARGAFIHALLKALAARGHAVRVLAPAQADAPPQCVMDDIDVRRVRYCLTAGGQRLTDTPGGIPEALRRYRTAPLQLGAMLGCFTAAAVRHAEWADVIYANWLGAGMAGAVARMLTGTPMVLTLRGDDAYWISQRPIWKAAGRFVLANCACVTAVSGNMPPLVNPLLPPRLRPAVVPTFGVDTDRFAPPPNRPPHAKMHGVCVGNVAAAKGVDVLLRALAKTRDAWERFTFVGGGGDLEKMQSLAAELGLGESVTWAGQRPADDVPRFLAEADVLVLPSLSEGRPNAVVEAMACGLAVIATNVGGVPELIADGHTGLLVPPADTDALADAISRLGPNAEHQKTLGRAARAFVVDNGLTWANTAGQFEKLFLDALNA